MLLWQRLALPLGAGGFPGAEKHSGSCPAAFLPSEHSTAGAVAVDGLTRIETPIPVEYVTDTGVTVSCTATIESSYFSPRFTEVSTYYRNADFTTSGLGQRIYEYALVLAGDKAGTPGDLPQSVQSTAQIPGIGDQQPLEDESALSVSMLEFIVMDVSDELGLPAGTVSGWAEIDSDCDGQLH
ncbi:hypothetical protein [Frigoribacterium sp. SL97]|uniref:hypothetical protein n=1 Tax=Frigoribacterium sp. SL97 TaxID=2994664 RepID=UPI002271BEB3|nr:hypothetical protein [Frigoribacterium sp. SL97]WAC51859.1 hypothetical protein OVA02_00830 [Frigoribacterium sp. SL97]